MFKKIQNWEYQIEYVEEGKEDKTEILRIMGINGWELVSVRSTPPVDEDWKIHKVMYYFKRPLND